jgi:hypothetical protein
MSEYQFNKGEFQAFKALTKVHLGSIGENLETGEVVLFDGSVLRRGSQDHPFPSLRGAIKVGWLVPETDTKSIYTPKAADIQIGDAVSKGEKRDMRPSKVTVAVDEQNVGDLQQVRGPEAPATHQAKNAGQTNTPASDGVVIAKLKTPAKSGPVEIGMDDRRVVTELDNKSRIAMEKIPVAVAANELVELFDDAVESGKPSPGVAGEGRGDESEARAKFAAGSSVTGGQEAGVIVKPAITATMPAAQILGLPVNANLVPEPARDFASKKELEHLAANVGALESKLDQILRHLEVLSNKLKPVREVEEVAKVVSHTPISEFKAEESNVPEDLVESQAATWTDLPENLVEAQTNTKVNDTTPHNFSEETWDKNLAWRVRVKTAVDRFGGSPEIIARIKAIEIDAVRNGIDKELAKRV